MLTFRSYPRPARRARQHDAAVAAVLVLPPGSSCLGTDRAFHVDALATTVRPRSGLQLRDLVALTAILAGAVHPIGFGDHHHPGCEAGAALVPSTAGHELERSAVAQLQGLHP